MPKIRIAGQAGEISVAPGTLLAQALRQAGVMMDSPCGGQGTCGKCKVLANGAEVLACRTPVHGDMEVMLPKRDALHILRTGTDEPKALETPQVGYLLAVDIGTTSVVCFLLEGKTGRELAVGSMENPQIAYGADVVSRIRAALAGKSEELTQVIRTGIAQLICGVCRDAHVPAEQISLVSVVGNPTMQQLFLGISPENLATIPFLPALTEAKAVPCADVLPLCPHARLLIVPDVSGYVGADTMGCLLSTELYKKEEITLLVDIGTNGEMVLGNQDRMISCATAAGPALEGANIRFGMRATQGAIDHVWVEQGGVRCSVLGGGEARGICGSGLLDAVAVALEMGLLNKRGRIQNPERILWLTQTVYLTQEDIRQVQLAKGAIRAGIDLMARQLGIGIQQIQRVQLAGAFGSFLDPNSACRIGLLPEELLGRIEAVGNAAGSGAKMLARNPHLLPLTHKLTERMEYLDLAGQPAFSKTFAKAMEFREENP